MLKLEKLEISGFKSFVEPVTLSFAGGITAIVGPNGCGKSNLSDAITWVLGEQSAKSLRGTRMEDVIFAGSEQRKPLGMAEVMLHLRTDPSFDHSQDGHVAIGRRVFRSGESQYRLNGRTVRLKEIRDLLMDTGLGIRAYSVIEQGKVGMILSGKPQERRRLLEEAAGITRYKQRKQVAEVKLEESVANLLRLDDIIAEVERSLRSLKRQAAAARRYKQQEAEYRDLLSRVLAGRWSAARKRLGEVAGRLGESQEREAALAAELSRLEAELAASRERGEELAAEVAERHQRHGELGATIEGRQQFLRSSRQRLSEIDERSGRSRHLAERRREEIAQHAEALAELAGRRESLEAELAAAADEVDRDEAQVTAAEERLRAAQARVEEGRRRLLAETAELNALRNRRHQGQIELEKAQYRREHLERELAEHETEVARASEALEAARRTVEELAGRIAERTAALEKVAKDLESTLQRENEASEKRRDLERRLADADQRRRLLVELGRAFAERRARLAEALEAAGEPPGQNATGTAFLADRVKALAGWEHSLDFFLSGLEHAVVLPSSTASQAGGADGSRALELARRLAGGPGAVVLEPVATGPSGVADPSGVTAQGGVEMPVVDDPAVVLSLGEALELPEDVAAALPPAFLVEHGADAARLARRHPGIAFLSREGFWAEGGAVHVEAGEAGPGVLEREREIQELERAIPRLQGELDEVTVLIGKLVERRSALARDSNQRQGELARLRQEMAVAEARSEDAAARHRRLGVERETLGVELEEVGREMARVAGDHQGVVEALAEAERRHAAVSAEGDAARESLQAAQAERESLREASAGRRGRLDLLRERLEAHDRDAARLAAEVERGEKQVREWSDEGERLTTRRGEIEAEVAVAERELQDALERRESTGEEVLAAQERLDEHRTALRRLEETLRGVRERREAARGEVEELRVRQAGLAQDAEHAAHAYREELVARALQKAGRLTLAAHGATTAEAADGEGGEGIAAEAPEGQPLGTASEPFGGGDVAAEAPAAAEAVAEPPVEVEIPDPPAEPPPNLPELEAELARLKAALERLGPVNVLAVEEHDEQQERHEFLTSQRADVADSVESLRRTIREINQASSERFRETFTAVNAHFGEIFSRLFRGGEAEMRLLDEEDLLESGIEIVARPPGKRLQNIQLMSGGEKALTAVALLFALFHAKPSPFCILDEVDAPLDDVNTLRFVELLKELAGGTQFLVITHNKLTMEAGSTLYGVTMQEKGVSQLVSVELDEVQPERATA